MPTDNTPITIRLAPALFDGVTSLAAALDFELPEAIEHLVREVLVDRYPEHLTADARAQMQAETDLWEIVACIIMNIRTEDTWGEDVTSDVFEKIQSNPLWIAPYQTAVASGQVGRINRRIGRLTRRHLNAEVIMTADGKREIGQPSRAAGSLIKTYTKLRRAA